MIPADSLEYHRNSSSRFDPFPRWLQCFQFQSEISMGGKHPGHRNQPQRPRPAFQHVLSTSSPQSRLNQVVCLWEEAWNGMLHHLHHCTPVPARSLQRSLVGGWQQRASAAIHLSPPSPPSSLAVLPSSPPQSSITSAANADLIGRSVGGGDAKSEFLKLLNDEKLGL